MYVANIKIKVTHCCVGCHDCFALKYYIILHINTEEQDDETRRVSQQNIILHTVHLAFYII